MKTFNDLKFERHPYDGEKTSMMFDNGYGVSVITGSMWYSSGTHENYELAIIDNDSLVYGEITGGDVLGYLTSEEVTDIMKQVQELEPGSYGVEDEELESAE